MPKKEPTVAVKFTRKELDLIFTEMNSAVENGAEDADYPVIRDKANKARIELIRRSTGQVTFQKRNMAAHLSNVVAVESESVEHGRKIVDDWLTPRPSAK